MLTRRQFSLLAASGAMLARPARAAAGERKFLFVHCSGGWDTNLVFTPMGPETVATQIEPEAVIASAGSLSFVDHPDRPQVRAFLDAHGGTTAFVNGIEIPSVTHERCKQMVLTGRGDAASDDWPTLLASGSPLDLTLPHLVIAGPAFAANHARSVVRVGDDGQLPDLLSGAAFQRSDLSLTPPREATLALGDAFVARRVAQQAVLAGRGAPRDILTAYEEALSRTEVLATLSGELDLRTTALGCERDIVADCGLAFDAMSLGITRCAMVQYNGWCDLGWDTHQEVAAQSLNFDELFRYLGLVLADVATRSTPTGTLAEELVVVVFSEMGRAPIVNAYGGKDHWTFTSAMLIGSGIRSGMVGAVDAEGHGEPVDVATGGAGSTHLGPEHLGATLLALGDLDPGSAGAPISAVLA